jgi:hypothetical protein
MQHRFRLRIDTRQSGKFHFNAAEAETQLSDELLLKIVARNADTLTEATAFHLDAGGFETDLAAREAGERMRLRVRILNALLDLGITVPIDDSVTAGASKQVKEEVLRKHNAVVIDSVWGVTTYPDDGRHFEYVMGGTIQVRPSDPNYLFAAIKTLWEMDAKLDVDSEEALNILNLATVETSHKARFLTTYLALEQLLLKETRSAAAITMLNRFRKQIKKAAKRKRRPLPASEVTSLSNAIGNLSLESFSATLMRFCRRLANPKEIKGRTPRQFFSECIETRNRIAHHAALNPSIPLTDLAAGLREVVLALIWKRNALQPLSIKTPASSVSIPEGGLKIRVL